MKKIKIIFLSILFITFIISLASCNIGTTTLEDYDMSGVTLSSSTVTYDGDSHSIKINGSLPDGVSVSYTYDGSTVSGETEVGSYTVVASFTGDTTEYNAISDMTATLKINAATISTTYLKFYDDSVVYDGEEHSIEVSGTIPDGVSISYTYDGEEAEGETEVGEYDIVATLYGADYDTTSLNATLTITQAYDFETNSDGEDTVTLTGYLGSETNITTPTTITDEGTTYTVTELGDECFKENLYFASIESVVVSNGIISIGDSCFKFCAALESVSLPSTLETIGDYSFTDCSNLTKITIPNSVTSIGKYCFKICPNLSDFTFEDDSNLKTISAGTFEYCDSIITIAIPDSVISISYDSFANCEDLNDITISNNVTSIGEECFMECTSLETITIPESVTSIGKKCFYDCDSLTKIIFEDTEDWYRSTTEGETTTSVDVTDSSTNAKNFKKLYNYYWTKSSD